MSALTKVKLGLTIIGLVIFAAGVRLDDARLRTIAIGFVAIAWIMRFVKPKKSADAAPPPDSAA